MSEYRIVESKGYFYVEREQVQYKYPFYPFDWGKVETKYWSRHYPGCGTLRQAQDKARILMKPDVIHEVHP